MKYFVRYIKIMPTSNKKNYPLTRLLFNYTGSEYEIIANYLQGTYNGITANECIVKFSHCLYKYCEKYIQVDNVVIIDNYKKYINKLKYDFGIIIIGNKLLQTIGFDDGIGIGQGNTYIINKTTPPDPFNLFDIRLSNKHEIKTTYSKSYKHEIYIGLYKYNDFTKQYEFLHTSLYDRKKQIYYLYEKKI